MAKTLVAGGILVLSLIVSVQSQTDDEVESTLRVLLTPDGYPSIQVQALRRDIIRKLEEELRKEQEARNLLGEYKRSWSDWPWGEEKRNLAALARNGYIRTLPPDDMFTEEVKRGIQSLARNGELRRPDNRGDDLYDKRGEPYEVRELLNAPPSAFIKRNVASLAREGVRINGRNDEAEKRNIGSIKAQYKNKVKRSVGRSKREVDYYDLGNEEFSSPVYQNQNVYDYEELMRALTGAYPETEKRFLGSVARSGWFRGPSSYVASTPEKRHIGSLARLGWLPSFRSVRRFNRSGRSANYVECRKATADGETKNDRVSQNSLPLESKSTPSAPFFYFRKFAMKHPRKY